MAETHRNSWRELCSAALEAKDPDELLEIVQHLSQALKNEEQVRRDFREAMSARAVPHKQPWSNGLPFSTSLSVRRGVATQASSRVLQLIRIMKIGLRSK
jgi:hypothetical protein